MNECLDKIVNMIFDKSLKWMVIDDLGLIRKHIESQLADVVNKEYIEDRVDVLSVLSQINKVIERFYSNDTEEKLNEQYNKVKQRVLS